MKISVITTCYNRKNTIADALESVLSQNYEHVETVVIDGGSTDGSAEIIKGYSSRLNYYVSEKDSGMYNALNKGIKQCTGEVIGLLHSDDCFYSATTISQIAEAFKNTHADIVYADGQYVEGEKMDKVKRIYRAKPFRKYFLYFGWIPLHTTIFAKREVFEQYGLYREDFNIASDYEISLRWFKNPKLKKVYLPEWVVKMRLGGKSTDMQQQKKKSAEDMRVIQQYKLWGYATLFFKIARKVPQYVLPKIITYK